MRASAGVLDARAEAAVSARRDAAMPAKFYGGQGTRTFSTPSDVRPSSVSRDACGAPEAFYL